MSLSRSALAMATPEFAAAPAQMLPSTCKGDTKVTSTPRDTPLYIGKPVATISKRRPSSVPMPGRAVSRRKAFSTTRALASRYTLARTRSKGLDRRKSRPEQLHDAQWSPSASSFARQAFPLQRLHSKGRGHRIVQRKATCIRRELICTALCVGIADSQATAPGPDWDNSIAQRASQQHGSNTQIRHQYLCEP